MTAADLLEELGSDTDLAHLIHRVCQEQLPWLVVSSGAVASWKQRDPEGWQKVSDWLAAQDIPLVPV